MNQLTFVGFKTMKILYLNMSVGGLYIFMKG